MEPHVFKKWVSLMPVRLPICLFPVDFNVTTQLLAVPQAKHAMEKIRASARVPASGGDYTNMSAVHRGDFLPQIDALSVPETADNPFRE